MFWVEFVFFFKRSLYKETADILQRFITIKCADFADIMCSFVQHFVEFICVHFNIMIFVYFLEVLLRLHAMISTAFFVFQSL